MLIEDWRPKLECKGIAVDNLSVDKAVFFIDEGHKYYHEDDITGKTVKDFNKSKYKFRSPTGILEEFKEHFDSVYQSKRYVKKHKLDITWEELMEQWAEKGRKASDEGTTLHAYSEALWNGWGMEKPDLPKADLVDEMFAELSKTYSLVKTELLVYSTVVKLAGQVDLLVKDKNNDLFLMDYKFLKGSIDKKSWFNPRTRKYKFMKGPFSHLHDCKLSHYSIQMSMYQMLMGKVGEKIKNKVLIVVTPDGVEYEDGIEMKIWVNKSGVLHAKYKGWNGKMYDSSKDKKYNGYFLIDK